MDQWLSRTSLLVGSQVIERLRNARAALLGLGGVGGSCAEALCRAGIGSLMLCDPDTVEETNLNRQSAALRSTLGRKKTDVVAERLKDINPDVSLTLAEQFYLPDNSNFLYDYQPEIVLDAIDTVTAKLHLAEECGKRGIPLITCLGTGNRLYPERLRTGDIQDTVGCGCPLARILRRELKKRGISALQVVFSDEAPLPCYAESDHGRHPPGSISFVPPAAGLILAGAAVRSLLAGK